MAEGGKGHINIQEDYDETVFKKLRFTLNAVAIGVRVYIAKTVEYEGEVDPQVRDLPHGFVSIFIHENMLQSTEISGSWSHGIAVGEFNIIHDNKTFFT